MMGVRMTLSDLYVCFEFVALYACYVSVMCVMVLLVCNAMRYMLMTVYYVHESITYYDMLWCYVFVKNVIRVL